MSDNLRRYVAKLKLDLLIAGGNINVTIAATITNKKKKKNREKKRNKEKYELLIAGV